MTNGCHHRQRQSCAVNVICVTVIVSLLYVNIVTDINTDITCQGKCYCYIFDVRL